MAKGFSSKGRLCEQGHRSREHISEITRSFVVAGYDELRVGRSCRPGSVTDLAGHTIHSLTSV